MKHSVTFQTSTIIFVVLSNFFFVPVNGFVSSFRMTTGYMFLSASCTELSLVLFRLRQKHVITVFRPNNTFLCCEEILKP